MKFLKSLQKQETWRQDSMQGKNIFKKIDGQAAPNILRRTNL